MKNRKMKGLYSPQQEHDSCGIGIVANIKGRKSHEIIEQGLTVLLSLEHRGACGFEENTGDGAGILLQIPHIFLAEACSDAGFSLPDDIGSYGVGMVFLPPDPKYTEICRQRLEDIVNEESQTVLGWRTVPVDASGLGNTAKECMPLIQQIFILRNKDIEDDSDFEKKLFVIRKKAEKRIRLSSTEGCSSFYIASLSCKTIVYKGMLMSSQVRSFFPDLANKSMETSIAMVHSRFSTNTFPSWERAQPHRYIVHNGEINTIRGNMNWMKAREAMLSADFCGTDISGLLPLIDMEGSDSTIFDNCLEYLFLAGRSLPHSMMMMIPEPWMNNSSMDDFKKAFYEYHSCLMEPWDGPAAIGFCDGTSVGAVLDRNGLRPARYYITKDDLLILASEVGVLNISPERILKKGRIAPGKMLLADTKLGVVFNDEDIKKQAASLLPYRKWLDKSMVNLEDLPAACQPENNNIFNEDIVKMQLAFGYTYEDLRLILAPMALNAVDPIGSMGTDSPLAVLSDKPQLLFNYFKQLFAQVTNPPIDAIREEYVTSMDTTIGSENNLFNPTVSSCKRIRLKKPILNNIELNKLRHLKMPGFKTAELPLTYNLKDEKSNLENAMSTLFAAADNAINAGSNILILSDRGIDKNKAAIPSLLAVSGLHHYLIKKGTRTKASFIIESAEPREVHHFALLIGYGAAAICPYLAFATIEDMIERKMIAGIDYKDAEYNFVKANTKGILKVLSKMGISTLQSYRGAQIFEAVGLKSDFVQKFFTGTPSKLEGVGLEVISREVLQRHESAFPSRAASEPLDLDSGGDYQWRGEGEYHLFNPETIHKLQYAARTNNYSLYREYADLINDQTQRVSTLRGLLEFKTSSNPVNIDEVESVDSICRRFKTGAMSYGSISSEAHRALAIAMNRLGGKSNTGEGGEDPDRFIPLKNGDSECSAIKQVASGRFGVTSEYLINAEELQIKIAQGAKPGEGGQLPGHKVYPWIAKARHCIPGVELISPPPHHDIYSIEDLAQLIFDLKNANRAAKISVKLVSEVGVGTVAAGVAKTLADVVLVSGYDGGTGASPRSSIRHAGLPWELGLAETHQTLVLNNLRSRIRVETDGKLLTGRDVVIATLLGAEEFGFATAPLIVLGCVMMRVCHLDTCPAGIATQNPELRKRFSGSPDYVVNLMRFIAQDVREIMAGLGFRSFDEMVGRTDVLETANALMNWKSKGLNLSPLLHSPSLTEGQTLYCSTLQNHRLENTLDMKQLLKICKPAIDEGRHVNMQLEIKNTDRAVGTILGSEVTRKYGAGGLPEHTIELNFKGSAGQSFGAFIPKGITLRLDGDANDYVGKGLSGGCVIIKPNLNSTFKPEDNEIIGNVAFYGGTSGEAYIEGRAGERFCVRNSGVNAVVEGIGDNGCEYMTGGCVVILGQTGRNLAAGMSGGCIYILDNDGMVESRYNKEMVDISYFNYTDDLDEIGRLKAVITKHRLYTGSQQATKLLQSWNRKLKNFVKITPKKE